MSILRSVGALVAAPALASVAVAQVPAAPAAPVAAGVPAAPVASPFPAVFSPLTPASPLTAPIPAPPSPLGIAPYPPPPGGPTLWSFLGMSYPQREYRQRRLARTPAGELRGRLQNPLSRLTGGLIPPFPPENPSLAELQAPGPVGAAAKVKLDRLAAKDRIEALKYLGTVDCHYWPEAEAALIEGLRVDRNEWVRLQAAKTLARGCCCTKKTIIALSHAATCSNADGNPEEKSPRVVAAAQAALSKCLAALCGDCPPVMMAPGGVVPNGGSGEGEKPRSEGEGPAQAAWSKPAPGMEKSSGGLSGDQLAPVSGAAYYERIDRKPWGEILITAKHALASAPAVPAEFALGDAGSDLELAEGRSRSDRPANLLDLLTGGEPAMETAMAAAPAPAPAMPPAPFRAPAQAAAPRPAAPVQAPVPTTTPVAAQTPPVPARIVPPAAPAPTPKPTVVMPVLAPATPPAQPAPVPQATPRAQVLPPTTVSPKMSRVTSLLAKPTDGKMVEKEVEQLTAAEITAHPAIVPALLQAAETMQDAGARTACVRALVRAKADTPVVRAGLQRLVNDRSVEVRVEAAAGLAELGAKK